MRIRPALVAVTLAACGNKPVATDAPPPVIDAPPPAIDAPISARCTPQSGTHVSLRQIAVSDDPPLLVTSPPGDDRLFVIEKLGAIRLLRDGVVEDPPFLDLRAATGGPVDAENREKGLLGLAFHPDYATNRKLYVYYTGHTVYRLNIISEYTTFADDPDHADPASRRDILQIRDYDVNHNGGHMAFDASGYLVIGTGDGGGGGDPNENGQDPNELLAKLLRIDVDNPSGTLLYGIPPENPYVLGGGRGEVYAIGLRNPWRWSLDPATGDLYIGDVGQDLWESIFVVPAGTLDGRNFGWNVAEGRHCYEARRCDRSKFTAPVTDYPHEQGCSVTGGIVYRGAALPALDGVYFYADYCIGWIRSFRWASDGIRQHWDWRPVLDPDAQITQVSSFGVDAAGELYLLSLDGTIRKFVLAS
jgi:glucose/arabinose dehydrogenase